MKWPSNPENKQTENENRQSLGGSLKDCVRQRINIEFEIL